VLQESVAVVRARPNVLLVRHRLGFISAAAGIDRSNVGSDDDTVLLLPEDPDASAARLCEAFAAAGAPNLAVVLSDSHGRAFRHGNVGVAIGAAGLPALIDLEGQPDLFGRPLTTASRLPLADLVASAATLVTGESAEGRPVVVVRGLQWTLPPGRASDLVRPIEQDLFAAADEDYG
jgi:coenzyme F420-0:L-glutamate ligase/coenzyme F420-1:gamma-L-glutamate ligase